MKRPHFFISVIMAFTFFILFCQCKDKSTVTAPNLANDSTSEKVPLTAAQKRIQDLKQANQDKLAKYIFSDCNESDPVALLDLSYALLKEYLHSSTRTKKEDSKAFCLEEIYNNDEAISRIYYERTDGGPYGDLISIYSLNKTTNQLWQYTLFSEFEKGGFHQKVSTRIKEPYTFVISSIENSKTKKNKKTINTYRLFKNGDVGI